MQSAYHMSYRLLVLVLVRCRRCASARPDLHVDAGWQAVRARALRALRAEQAQPDRRARRHPRDCAPTRVRRRHFVLELVLLLDLYTLVRQRLPICAQCQHSLRWLLCSIRPDETVDPWKTMLCTVGVSLVSTLLYSNICSEGTYSTPIRAAVQFVLVAHVHHSVRSEILLMRKRI